MWRGEVHLSPLLLPILSHGSFLHGGCRVGRVLPICRSAGRGWLAAIHVAMSLLVLVLVLIQSVCRDRLSRVHAARHRGWREEGICDTDDPQRPVIFFKFGQVDRVPRRGSLFGLAPGQLPRARIQQDDIRPHRLETSEGHGLERQGWVFFPFRRSDGDGALEFRDLRRRLPAWCLCEEPLTAAEARGHLLHLRLLPGRRAVKGRRTLPLCLPFHEVDFGVVGLDLFSVREAILRELWSR
mmetsp:Transcript_15505/g.44304  ORF Transcript_15505/g.44304 Transcript_15505/m.44304 type:complete len:240 (-) Transcript_15505:315-1034(-)